ncbi:MAG: hydantoinase B/oxoprolinase family protein, partial [bacterium]
MTHDEHSNWQVWIDTGGTFTDCLALDPNGTLHREKVLSSSALRGTVEEVLTAETLRISATWRLPADFIRDFRFCLLETHYAEKLVKRYDPAASTIELDGPLGIGISGGTAFEVRSPEEAPLLAARLVSWIPAGSQLPGISMRLATTRGTNALLERRGAPIVLFITRGFGDLLRIGNQQRPDLFALHITKPEPLYKGVVEVPERIDANGTILEPLRPEAIANEIRGLVESGIRWAAVVFMHSYINPDHERVMAEYLLENGFQYVSCSSSLAPFIKIVPRAETTVVDAYLAPVIKEYVERVQSPLAGGRLHVMTSAGGMIQPEGFHAKDSLLSGPAGGVVGAALAGRRSGFARVIAFDMGGTSTDVARFDNDYDYVFEHEVGGAHLVAPALAVESVAAGGGSMCRFDGTELHVGPESAGAVPGPASYGAGGPLTLTDANLLLGRLDGSRFEIPIDAEHAKRELEKILGSIEKRKGEKPESEKLLEGFCDIANERMADAIRRISIRKGYDPCDYTLVAFGGAGGQHACAVAGQLGIDTILIPPDASLLSAMGLGSAVIERFAERQILESLEDVREEIPGWVRELAGEAIAALKQEGVERKNTEVRRRIVSLRFAGQDSVLQVEYDETSPLQEAFESKYRAIFGHWQADRPIEVESIRVVVSSIAAGDFRETEESRPVSPSARRHMQAYFDGAWRPVPLFERDDLSTGSRLNGPALVFERYSMTVVESGWTAVVDGAGALVLKKKTGDARTTGDTRKRTDSPQPEPVQPEVVRLELFTNRFRTIATEMGEMLRRTALSTNVKERLDFSCTIHDRKGELVVNAPHIAVHLGAMGLCVRGLREALSMGPGDVVITNHPEYGGSHLPDVSVVTPVFMPDGRLLGFVANRAHHAEIGGARPGSMPPTATTLAEEGVVIPPIFLFKDGRARWDELYRLLTESPYPSRAVEENMADVRAAVAANRNGTAALLKLAWEHGAETIQ